MNNIDFSKPIKTEPLPEYTPTVKKCSNNDLALSNSQKKILSEIKQSDNVKKIKEILLTNANWLFDDMYKSQNILFFVTNFLNADFIEPSIKNINSLNLKSIPKLQYRFDTTATDKVLVFDIGTNEHLVPFNKNTATDRAKSEFYEDVKELIEAKFINAQDILDSTYWYQNKNGTQIYLLNPNIGGFLESRNEEKVKKAIFNTLFN